MLDTKSYNQIRNEFYKNFRLEILPIVSKYDNERKKLLKKALLISSLLFICSVLLFILPGLFSYGIYVFITMCITYHEIKKRFENKIKQEIMPKIISYFEKISWKEGGTSEGYIYEFVQVVPEHDFWKNDDVFEGEHNGVKFEIAETKFYKEIISAHKDRRGRDVESLKRKVFQGIIIKLQMNKNFTGHTLIKPDSFHHLSPKEYMQRTVLESIEFEEKYDVFTTDEIEARYIITPSFMNRLNNIKTAFKVEKLSCGFFNNYLYIALPTKQDIFSICALHRPIDDSTQYFKMFEEIFSIIKLIDHFKLDQKIGL